MVIENAAHAVSPLRVCQHTVNITLGCTAVTHQNDMLLIVALCTHGAQHGTDQVPFQRFCGNVGQEKASDKPCRKLPQIRILSSYIQNSSEKKQSDDIRLADVGKLLASALHPLWREQMKDCIQKQIDWYDHHQDPHIKPGRQDTSL